jgi:hypothetical protein
MPSPVDIPYPTSTNPGNAPGEGSGRIVNCYAYMDGGAPRWKPLPGLTPFATLPVTGEVRGYTSVSGQLIAVAGSDVIQCDASGAVTLLEEQVFGSGPVTIARNNATIPDVVIASSSGLSVLESGVVEPYSTGVTTVDFTPAALPPINSVSFLDGYFLFTSLLGQIYASQLNSTDVSALSFTTAEAKPDPLLRGVVYGLQFFACGAETIEVYQDVGTLPFPLARSTVIPIGIIGPWAIAGFEDGWTGPMILVAQDGSVRRLDGYIPTRVSNDDLESRIAAVAVKTDLRASVYTFGGNAIWSLSSPTWTWEYNVTTGAWNERESYGMTRWLAGKTFNVFGEWIAADNAGGALYLIEADERTENGTPVIWGMDSGPVKQFPVRIQIASADFDFVLGQAPILVKPDAMLSWSHNAGETWSNPLTRSVGLQAQTKGRVQVNRIGLSSPAGVRFRFRVSDPAFTSFAGGRCAASPRN